MKCQRCGKDFQAKRKSARFCSSRCRKLAFHSKEVSVPKVSVPAIKENAKNDGWTIEDEARKRATVTYLKRGYFGGKANMESKLAGGVKARVVVSRTYFDLEDEYIRQLTMLKNESWMPETGKRETFGLMPPQPFVPLWKLNKGRTKEQILKEMKIKIRSK